MFVAAYWWKVHPGKEEQFRAAWRRGTELIQAKYGSQGSRLHWDEREARFVGIAEWPDRATSEAGEEPLLLLEVTDDLLGRG